MSSVPPAAGVAAASLPPDIPARAVTRHPVPSAGTSGSGSSPTRAWIPSNAPLRRRESPFLAPPNAPRPVLQRPREYLAVPGASRWDSSATRNIQRHGAPSRRCGAAFRGNGAPSRRCGAAMSAVPLAAGVAAAPLPPDIPAHAVTRLPAPSAGTSGSGSSPTHAWTPSNVTLRRRDHPSSPLRTTLSPLCGAPANIWRSLGRIGGIAAPPGISSGTGRRRGDVGPPDLARWQAMAAARVGGPR